MQSSSSSSSWYPGCTIPGAEPEHVVLVLVLAVSGYTGLSARASGGRAAPRPPLRHPQPRPPPRQLSAAPLRPPLSSLFCLVLCAAVAVDVGFGVLCSILAGEAGWGLKTGKREKSEE
eukprot:1641398-Rhodomonas_salina.1